ncbi:tripartite motif-containing 16-like protein [Labeo rohita]|uniref:Tripartite motif-containing 16-like protein n=1 Tax=Labeo rohita TaxID=84645 RepID=A0A498MII9_LABRO|nr:tripartite motif-containing 16-like protein [Labeo rohita]
MSDQKGVPTIVKQITKSQKALIVVIFSRYRDNLHQFSRQTLDSINGTVKTIQFIGAPDYQARKEFIRLKTAFQLRDNLHQFSRQTLDSINGTVKTIQFIGAPDYQARKEFIRLKPIQVIIAPEYETREEFLQLKTIQVIIAPEYETREEFLQSVPELTGLAVRCHLSFDAVVKTVFQLRDKLHLFSRQTLESVTGIVKAIQFTGAPDYQARKEFIRSKTIQVIIAPEYETREEFLQLKTIQVIIAPEYETREEFLQCELL